MVNKVAAVDAALRNAEPSDPRVVLKESTPTEKVLTVVVVYIPQCLAPTLLSGICSPNEAWVILRNRDKKLRISDACF